MRFRLEPADEYMHPLEDASNFNESMYFNVVDPRSRVGAFFRLGNRANEGYAEMTVCLYLPDGRVGFMYGRPDIADNAAFDAGGMRIEVVEPFEKLTVDYVGKVVILEEPLDMADPRTAFRSNPWEDARASIRFTGVSPTDGGEPVDDEGAPLDEAVSGFARGHYEQHTAGTGTISVGDSTWTIDGFGLRDHSWGPRFWQAPWWYRWLTANFEDDLGFVVTVIGNRDGSRHIGGMLFRDGEYDRIVEADVETTWVEGDYHERIHASVTTASGADATIEGSVLNLIPLRNRRTSPDGESLVTRISEGLTEWTLDGRTGFGLSEYLDQMVDGRPVGLAG